MIHGVVIVLLALVISSFQAFLSPSVLGDNTTLLFLKVPLFLLVSQVRLFLFFLS